MKSLKKGLSKGFTSKTKDYTPKSNLKPEFAGSSMYEKISSELSSMGIVQFDNDSIEASYLQLPALLTDVPSKELGNYFTTFTQQKMWVRTLRGRVKAELREANLLLDEYRFSIYQELNDRMSSKDKELRVMKVPEAPDLIKRIAYLASKLDMLEDYLLNLEDAIINISREITRRSNDIRG